MKQIFTILFFTLLTQISKAQFIQGSIQQGTIPNTVNIVYLPNHNSTVGEYVNYLSISIAIPLTSATGVTPTIAGVGNFASLSFTPAIPFSYTQGTEKIFSWVCPNGTPLTMSWSNGISFVGATITFTGGSGTSKIRLVDFTNLGGGTNGNTFFNVGVNIPPFDLTNYSNIFYSIAGGNGSSLGAYPNTDQYVETNLIIAVPVGLTNFIGYKRGNKNMLQWTTLTESNNSGFEIQRSADGENFISIGFVNSLSNTSNSSSELNYTYSDNNPPGIKQYYRLNQIDFDNNSRLSNIISISGTKPLIMTMSGLYPNPVNKILKLNIESPSNEEVKLVIIDMAGKIVKQQTQKIETGMNTPDIDISSISKGSYLLILISKDENVRHVEKFIKD